jgi:hypothetical protein
MKTFKSTSDVEQLRNDPVHSPIYDTVKELVVPVIAEYTDSVHPYSPENDGYLVLIEPSDVDRVLDDLDMPWRLSEVPFEGVTMVDGFFYAVYVANNQFSIGILVPNEDWLPDELRRHLEDHLDP